MVQDIQTPAPENSQNDTQINQIGDQNEVQNGQNGTVAPSGDFRRAKGYQKVNGNKFTSVYQPKNNYGSRNTRHNVAPAQVNYNHHQNQFPTAGNGVVSTPNFNNGVWNNTPVATVTPIKETKQVENQNVDISESIQNGRQHEQIQNGQTQISQNGLQNEHQNTQNSYENGQNGNTKPRYYPKNYTTSYPLIQIDDFTQILTNPIPKAYHRSPDIQLASELEDSEKEQQRKLFIGGLSYQTDDKTLYEHFSKYGDLTDCVVMKDPRTKRSRGFGFVCFQRAHMLEKCMADRPHTINGRPVEPKRAVSRLESGKPGANRSVNKLHVKWAPPAVLTKQDFEEYFSKYGEIKENGVEIPKNKDTGASRNYAFVSFTDYDVVDKIICDGKKAVQQTPRNSEAVNAAIKQIEAERASRETSDDDKDVKYDEGSDEKSDDAKLDKSKTDLNKSDSNKSDSGEKLSDGSVKESTSNSSLILTQVKAKDLVNQHTINGVLCQVNKGFSQDEMKEIKNNMQEKHNAMERAKARNQGFKVSGMSQNGYQNSVQNGIQSGMQNGFYNGFQNGQNAGFKPAQNGGLTGAQKNYSNGYQNGGQSLMQNGFKSGAQNNYKNNQNGYKQTGYHAPGVANYQNTNEFAPNRKSNNSPKPAQNQKFNRQNSGNSQNHSRTGYNFSRNTNSPKNRQNFRQNHKNPEDRSSQSLMGRYQGPMPVGSSPTNVRTSGGHVTHNPPHLNDNEMIDQNVVATMEQQISEMDQQLQGIGGVYGFGQLYPTYPYGYDANYYYQQSYYHQMINQNQQFYQSNQQTFQQQVIPQNVKPSPGLWVPPSKEAQSIASDENTAPEVVTSTVTATAVAAN